MSSVQKESKRSEVNSTTGCMNRIPKHHEFISICILVALIVFQSMITSTTSALVTPKRNPDPKDKLAKLEGDPMLKKLVEDGNHLTPRAKRADDDWPFLSLSQVPRKRSYVDLQCRGRYDRGYIAELERICDDCYNLFRAPEMHGLCRARCFSSDMFKTCVEALLLTDDAPRFREMIQIVGKKRRRRK